MYDITVSELERDIRHSKDQIALDNALQRLLTNTDFQEVIVKGLFEREAIRLVGLKADPSQQSQDKQAQILRDIDGIGFLHTYLRTITQIADIARKNLPEQLAALDDEDAGV